MSRTDGIKLPRLPTSHVKATYSEAVQHHQKRRDGSYELIEPHYTAYLGTPRQDVPSHVYRDAAMFDDVFDKQGRLLTGRTTPKFTSPLNSLEYNSLHDPHCRRLFLNNQALRSHLTSLGLLTDDLRVVATTKEQRQKVRGHELLERKEEIVKKMSEREKQRIERLQRQVSLPSIYQQSLVKEEIRKQRLEEIKKKKYDKQKEQERVYRKKEEERKREKKKQLQHVLEHVKLIEQTQRNAVAYEQREAELHAYRKHYGEMGVWHRESDLIHNRMVYLEKTRWSKQRKTAKSAHKDWLSESYPKSKITIVDSSDSKDTKDMTAPICLPTVTPATTSTPGATVMEDMRGMEGDGHTDETSIKEEPKVIATVSAEQDIERRNSSIAEAARKMSSTKAHEEISYTAVEKENKDKIMEEKREDEKAPDPPQPPATVVGKPTQQDDDIPVEQVESETFTSREDVTDEQKHSTDQQTTTEEETEETPIESGTADTATEDEQLPAARQERVAILSQEESYVEITNLFFDIFQQYDTYGSGHIRIETFHEVMSSSDMGLPLDKEEIHYIGSQISTREGWIPLQEGTMYLPNVLTRLFHQRLGEQIEHYGRYIEDRWVQLSSPNMGFIYLDKTTGLVQRGGRPFDYRPYLRNDWFEDVIVELYETADKNRDGYVDQNEMYEFLYSPIIHSRVYSHQLDKLVKVFLDRSVDGVMNLEQFVPFAHLILQLTYSNSYPNKEWVELQSRKCGKYFFNPSTGETKLPDPTAKDPPSSRQKPKSRRRRRESRKSREEKKEETAPSQKPPPLRQRSGKPAKSDDDITVPTIQDLTADQSEGNIKIIEPVSMDSSDVTSEVKSIEESNDELLADTSIAEQLTERLQKGLNIIDTIPEEDEEQGRPISAMQHSQQQLPPMVETPGAGERAGESSTVIEVPSKEDTRVKNGDEQTLTENERGFAGEEKVKDNDNHAAEKMQDDKDSASVENEQDGESFDTIDRVLQKVIDERESNEQ